MNVHRIGPRAKDDPCEFKVVGERRDDPGHLLALGSDGHWYDYDITGNRITPVELSDSWAIDVAASTPQHVPALPGKLAS